MIVPPSNFYRCTSKSAVIFRFRWSSCNWHSTTIIAFGLCIVHKNNTSIQCLPIIISYFSIFKINRIICQRNHMTELVTFPFISSTALWASSCEAKVTNPNPFDRSETLSDTTWAAKTNKADAQFNQFRYSCFYILGSDYVNITQVTFNHLTILRECFW